MGGSVVVPLPRADIETQIWAEGPVRTWSQVLHLKKAPAGHSSFPTSFLPAFLPSSVNTFFSFGACALRRRFQLPKAHGGDHGDVRDVLGHDTGSGSDHDALPAAWADEAHRVMGTKQPDVATCVEGDTIFGAFQRMYMLMSQRHFKTTKLPFFVRIV